MEIWWLYYMLSTSRRKSSCLIAGLDLTPARYPHNGKPEELWNENPPGKFTEQLWTCLPISYLKCYFWHLSENNKLHWTYQSRTTHQWSSNFMETINWSKFIMCLCLGTVYVLCLVSVSVCIFLKIIAKSEQHRLQNIWPFKVMIMWNHWYPSQMSTSCRRQWNHRRLHPWCCRGAAANNPPEWPAALPLPLQSRNCPI